MVGLSKIVTLLTAAMVVLCLIGVATPAFAQMYGGKGIPQASNMGANANANMGMGKGMPQANQPMEKGMPQANANQGMGKGMPQTSNMPANANMGMSKGMEKGGYGGGLGGFGGQDMARGGPPGGSQY